MNSTTDASRNLRHIRLILLSTLLIIGLTGSCLVLIWLIRYTKRHLRSTRICSLILNLVVANLCVYTFATGIQIFWEFQINRQWPFNDFLCRLVKFGQSFSILSSTYLVVAMAIDRCIAILTPLKAGQIRVLYLCGTAWCLAAILSTPNIFIFKLHSNKTARYCSARYSNQPTLLGRRIYLTFISLVVYFIPFLVLVLCYMLIFVKLLCHEHDYQPDRVTISSSTSLYSRFFPKPVRSLSQIFTYSRDTRQWSTCSALNELDIGRKRASTYAKARSKTFRMIIVLVLFMIICGAPYYCLELYIIYTGRFPSVYISALAGGAAVAPSSIDPWIFLLFWVNWNEPADENSRAQRLIQFSNHQQQQQNPYHYAKRVQRSNTLCSSSSSEPYQNHLQRNSAAHLSPSTCQTKRLNRIQERASIF